MKSWQDRRSPEDFSDSGCVGSLARFQLLSERKGSSPTQWMKLYLTIWDCLGFQFSLMEVSCGGFSCQECHQNVVPPGGSPVKTEWQSELRRDGKRDGERGIMVRRESNKNMVDSLRSKRGQMREREKRGMGHSKDFWKIKTKEILSFSWMTFCIMWGLFLFFFFFLVCQFKQPSNPTFMLIQIPF